MPRINPGGPWLRTSPPPTVETVTGHYLWLLQRVQITRVEPQPPLADHYSRLFFGRSTPIQLGQPFFLWQPAPRIDEPEQIVAPQVNFAAFRQYIPAVAGPGQPWYQWPPIKVEITPEEQMFRENHALSLYPFLPHQGVVPVPDLLPGGGGGSGRPVYARRKKSLNEELNEIVARIGTFDEPLLKAAREVVREQKKADTPIARVGAPNFKVLREEVLDLRKRVVEIETRSDDDDDEEILLLGA